MLNNHNLQAEFNQTLATFQAEGYPGVIYVFSPTVLLKIEKIISPESDLL